MDFIGGASQRPPIFPVASSLAWLAGSFFGQKSFSIPHIFQAGSLMNVTFILLSSSLLLTSVLRLMVFHKLKNISPVDQIFRDLRFYINKI